MTSDALQTSYKSSYESASLGALGGVADQATETFMDKGDSGGAAGPTAGGGRRRRRRRTKRRKTKRRRT